uniref:Uncharacterized protein n=1 Tax=uncultured Nocardioidaceae bacterium TaxID=253824 RepID=A0A6J4LDV3_9ACTN|nr:MAG: hypothetical protein AVDCRST_MAG46-1310 [uncultured Nocardioidaceae bacterium]
MNTTQNRSTTMNLMHEDLARAHNRERLEQAREAKQADHVARGVRLARRAERTAYAVKLHLARGL